MIFCRFLVGIQVWARLRACLHGGERPQVGKVTRLGGVNRLPDRVTLPAGVKFCHVNVSR